MNDNNNNNDHPAHLLNYDAASVDELPEFPRQNDHQELYLDVDHTPTTTSQDEKKSKLSASLLYVNNDQTTITENSNNLEGAYNDISDLSKENYVTTDEDEANTCHTIGSQNMQKMPVKTSTVAPGTDLLQWNTKFQRIVNQDKQDHEKYLLDFHELSREFTETASRIAVEIISSLIVDDETDVKKLSDLQRTVNKRIGIRKDAIYKPDSSKGGVAGENGIFFKLAVDSVGLYGSRLYSHLLTNLGGNEFSMKAASHELRSMQQVMKCHIPDLHVPIMTIIDWGGFRILAQSFLPISPLTLKYGSEDGGKSVVNSSPKIESLVKQFAHKLNLKEHIVEWINSDGIPQKTPISGPADMEIHEGFDDRNYVVDCARFFPPEPRFYILNVVFIPSEDFSSLKNIEINFSQWDKAVCGLLGVKSPNQLKRLWLQESELIYADHDHVDNNMTNKRASYLAELSKESSCSVSALAPLIFGDAIFIHGGKGGSFLYNLLRPELVKIGQPLSSDAFSRFGRNDFEKHNAEVQQSFSNLGEILLPTSNSLVTEVIPNLAKKLNDTSQLLLFQNHSPSISKLLHKYGIPLRMMENMRCQITNNVIQNLLLMEMVTRVLKNLFRSELRCLHSRDPHSLASCAISFFNKVLGESTAASQFWGIQVYCHILRKYGLEQQITSSGNSAHLHNVIHKPSLFSSLQYATGFKFRQEINDNAQQHPEIFSEENPFALFHLEGWDNTKVYSETREEVQKVLIRIQKPNVKCLLDSDAVYQIFEQKIQKISPNFCYIENLQDATKLVEEYTSIKERVTKVTLDSSFDLVKVYTVRSAYLLLKSQQYEKALGVIQEFLPSPNNNSSTFGNTIHSELLIGAFYIAASANHGLQLFQESVKHFKTAILLLEKLHGSIRYNSFSHPFAMMLFNGLVESLLEHSTKVSEEIFRHSQYFLAMMNFFPFTSRLKKNHAKFLFGKEGIPSCLRWMQSQDVIQNSEVRNYFPEEPSSSYSDSEFDLELQNLLLFWNPLNFTGISTSPESLQFESPVLPPASKSSPFEHTISLFWGANFNGECFASVRFMQRSSQFDFVDMPNSAETVFGGNVNIKDAQCGDMFSILLFENGELWAGGVAPHGYLQMENNSLQHQIENKKASRIWTKYKFLFVECEDKSLYAFGVIAPGKVEIPNRPEYSEIVQISSDEGHYEILFTSGKILAYGIRSNLKHARTNELVEIETPPGERVVSIASAPRTTAFLCESGSVYVFGEYPLLLGTGKLGELEKYEQELPYRDLTQWNKVRFPENVKIKEISFGLYHALALSEDGKVYAWGSNSRGQLGIGSRTSQSFPRLVSFLNDEKIASVCAGIHLSYAVTKSGKLFGWGDATFGQLSTLSQKIVCTPKLITTFPVSCKILKVHIGGQKVAAVARVETTEPPVSQENAKVFLKKSPTDIETSSPSSTLSDKITNVEVPNKIIHCGYLEHGFQCTWKEPLILKELNPPFLQIFPITEVALGKCHMLALNCQGKVFSFGQGTQGALGLGHTSVVTHQLSPIKFLADKVVTTICCGASQCGGHK